MNLAISAQENLTVIISGLSFMFVLVIAVFGLVIRITRKWSKMESDLTRISDNLAEAVRDNKDAHIEIAAQMREDRHVANERLTWLERNVYSRLIPPPGYVGGP